jgi:hypothetical protein
LSSRSEVKRSEGTRDEEIPRYARNDKLK